MAVAVVVLPDQMHATVPRQLVAVARVLRAARAATALAPARTMVKIQAAFWSPIRARPAVMAREASAVAVVAAAAPAVTTAAT